MSDEVLVERHGAVQVITINRPEARNALNGAVAAGVRDAADELDADGALQVGVLTGAGGTFSAGMDLKAFLKGETPSFPGRDRRVQGVASLRPVNGDDLHRAMALDQHLVAHPASVRKALLQI